MQRALFDKHIQHAMEIEPFRRLAQPVVGKFKNAVVIPPPGTCLGCQVGWAIVTLETRLFAINKCHHLVDDLPRFVVPPTRSPWLSRRIVAAANAAVPGGQGSTPYSVATSPANAISANRAATR